MAVGPSSEFWLLAPGFKDLLLFYIRSLVLFPDR